MPAGNIMTQIFEVKNLSTDSANCQTFIESGASNIVPKTGAGARLIMNGSNLFASVANYPYVYSLSFSGTNTIFPDHSGTLAKTNGIGPPTVQTLANKTLIDASNNVFARELAYGTSNSVAVDGTTPSGAGNILMTGSSAAANWAHESTLALNPYGDLLLNVIHYTTWVLTTSWQNINGRYLFAGTSIMTPDTFYFQVQLQSGSSNVNVRIYDNTNANTISTQLITPAVTMQVYTTNTFANLSANAAEWLFQASCSSLTLNVSIGTYGCKFN
jgi:hypothetical protein